MTYPFNSSQSAAIDDRIVEMIAAAIGEGAEVRRARAIANERYLDRQAEDNGVDDSILSADIQPVATAPRDRFLMTHCPDAPRCITWPTAPWIVAKWHDDTDAWRDEDGIQVQPAGWLPLSDCNLRLLSPKDSGLPAPSPAAPPHHQYGAIMISAEAIRLECLKLAAAGGGNATTVLDAARRFERFVTAKSSQVAACAPASGTAEGGTSQVDIENDGAVTSMLPDE
jgi:hypothetical protein